MTRRSTVVALERVAVVQIEEVVVEVTSEVSLMIRATVVTEVVVVVDRAGRVVRTKMVFSAGLVTVT